MTYPSRTGLSLAAGMMLGWLASLVGLLSLNLGQLSWLALAALVLVRTLLQTGLFIVAHDAMHGVLLPGRLPWNDRLGAWALACYAALPYAACQFNHRRHHQSAATAEDPDFHADPDGGVWRWYLRFMAGYLTAGQMTRLLGGWLLLGLIASACSPSGWINVLLFCTVPLLLSSLQLFLVGTYLPHRVQRSPLGRSRPDSLHLPAWLSLLACYHFGYHREHHERPDLCWFELPAEHRRRTPNWNEDLAAA